MRLSLPAISSVILCWICLLVIPAEACMQFNISGPQLAGLVALGIIFSPVIAVGAVVYHSGKAVSKAVDRASDALREAKLRSEAERDNRNAMETARAALYFNERLAGENAVSLTGNCGAGDGSPGTAEIAPPQESLMQLAEVAKAERTFTNVMKVACMLFTAFEDYISAHGYFKDAAGLSDNAEEKGTALFMFGLCASRMNRFHEAFSAFLDARVLLPRVESTADMGPRPFYAHFASFQAAWVALTLHLYPFTCAMSNRHSTNGNAAPSVDVAIQLLDECRIADTTDMAAVFYSAIARFYHSRDPDADREYRQAALSLVRQIPDDDVLFGAKARALEAQALALQGDLAQARELQQKSIAMDSRIHRPLLYTGEGASAKPRVESILAPWPVPDELFRGCGGAHEWKETRFMKPTWCDKCMQFVTLGQNIDKCFECKACGLQVHRECKERIGDAPQCLAAARRPAFQVGNRVKCGSHIGTVQHLYVDRGTVVVNWETSRRSGRSLPSEVLASQCECLEMGTLLEKHTHTFRKTDLHKPTFCDECDKFIWVTHALKCEICRSTIHEKCVDAVQGVVAADEVMTSSPKLTKTC